VASLAEIRKKLQEQENRSNNRGKGGGDNLTYPHWNLPDNESSTLRFVEDGDTNNDYFWKERLLINLQFSGVKGQDEGKPVTVKVPCIEMWSGKKCPILEEIRPWFNDTSMEELARKYWKKRSYIYQGFVVQSGFDEEDAPENKIRRFVINSQIHKSITSALMDPDFGDHMPTDVDDGTDYKVIKTKNGAWAQYTTSQWSRRSRSLDEQERDAIATHGLPELSGYLPKQPSSEELDIIMQMFESSVDGELYDVEKFGHYYRPWGVNAPETTSRSDTQAPANSANVDKEVTKPASKTAHSVKAEPTPEPDTPEPDTSDSGGQPSSAQDILRTIRARKTS
jgi:hypothetical protein